MHIPDGFLSNGVAAACWVPTVAVLAVAVRRTNGRLDERRIPLLGVTAAFVFAAQMLNFPVAGGTSGHFLGAAARGGAARAMGGVRGDGDRISNAGVPVRRRRRHRPRRQHPQHGRHRRPAGRASRWPSPAHLTRSGRRSSSSWASVRGPPCMVGATATSMELASRAPCRSPTVLPTMLGVHALIGVGEAIDHRGRRPADPGRPPRPRSGPRRPRPELDDRRPAPGRWPDVRRIPHPVLVHRPRGRPWPGDGGRAVRVPSPDGLETVAADKGFDEHRRCTRCRRTRRSPGTRSPASGTSAWRRRRRLRRHARRVGDRRRRAWLCGGATTTAGRPARR